MGWPNDPGRGGAGIPGYAPFLGEIEESPFAGDGFLPLDWHRIEGRLPDGSPTEKALLSEHRYMPWGT